MCGLRHVKGGYGQAVTWEEEEEEEDGAGQTVLGPQPPRAWQLCSAELQGSPGWHRLFQVLGIFRGQTEILLLSS